MEKDKLIYVFWAGFVETAKPITSIVLAVSLFVLLLVGAIVVAGEVSEWLFADSGCCWKCQSEECNNLVGFVGSGALVFSTLLILTAGITSGAWKVVETVRNKYR